MRLFLIELGLLPPNNQYALIKISEYNTCTQAIQQDLDNACKRETSESSIIVPPKDDN